MKISALNISDIVITDRQRDVDAGVVVLLSENIAQNGLLQPIGVNHNRRTNKFELLYGAHRLAACQRLNFEEIDCVVLNVNKDAAAVIEADENFIRSALKPLEFAKVYKARKRAYEALHPETKKGGYNRLNVIMTQMRQNCEGIKRQNGGLCSDRFPPFIQYAADHLGFSVRKIERYLALDKAIFNDVQAAIKNHHSAAHYGELKLLSQQNEADQKAVANLIKDNPEKTISECVETVNPTIKKVGSWEKDYTAITSRFFKSGKKAKVKFLDDLAKEKLPGGYRLIKEGESS